MELKLNKSEKKKETQESVEFIQTVLNIPEFWVVQYKRFKFVTIYFIFLSKMSQLLVKEQAFTRLPQGT